MRNGSAHPLVAVLLLAGLAGTAAAAAAITAPIPAVPIPSALADCKDPVCYSGSGLRIDARSNQIELSDFEAVDTTHGELTYISADQLSAGGITHGTGSGGKGPDLGNSRWTLSGHVLAETQQGRFAAQSATVQLADQRIASIVAEGHPARFVREAGAGPVSPGTGKSSGGLGGVNLAVHGHADTITYDVAHARVQLTGDSWLSDGCNEITSQRIIYDMRTQSVEASASPGSGGRVHGTLRTTRPGGSCAAGIKVR